jgi:iron-sulfur cluster protein
VSYRRELRQALDDRFLGRVLSAFATSYRESREAAFAGEAGFEAAARRVAAVRGAALSRLEELVERFVERCEAAGARVHRAASAAEAREIIASIAREAKARRVVKSKSMTAEEIHLNPHLERAGLDVVETDLGEWILQQRREAPSHMVMPAIHLSRRQVAGLFTEHTGRVHDPDDIEGMVRTARAILRQAFLTADVGITGANFAVAETGTLGLLTNEGNGRLVTTLPRVHVALLGIEKVVADVGGALDLLHALPRSATGQTLTSYVTWITGPGPGRELHVVLLDGGRRRVARDEELADVLRCIRCGACANVCPVFRLVGGHRLGEVYVGPVGLVLSYCYHDRARAGVVARNCIGCLACKRGCPAGIDLPRLIKTVAHRVQRRRGRLVGRLVGSRVWLHRALRLAAAVQPLDQGQGLELPAVVPAAHRFRRLPLLSSRPLRERLAEPARAGPRVEPRGQRRRVVLFAGCLVDFVFPEQGEALYHLLRGTGTHVQFPEGQGCCGLPAAMMGQQEAARRAARANVDAICSTPWHRVVVLCASCGSFIRERYPELLAGDPARAALARRVAASVVDLSTLLLELGLDTNQDQARAQTPQGRPVAYHSPCHMRPRLAPEGLIHAAGHTYLRTADEDLCCGFGGSYSFEFPEISSELAGRKLEGVVESGAELLVTDCPGCVLQLRGTAAARGMPLRVLHMAELLACAVPR